MNVQRERRDGSGGGPRRRSLLGLGAAGLLGAGGYALTGCASGSQLPAGPGADRRPGGGADPGTDAAPSVERPRLIGDGSTADTGPQPHQPLPRRLEKGERPPQFVVFSWDGAASLDDGLFARFREVAKETGAAMTFFLSGLYLLPESQRQRYRPPGNPVGASDIGYLGDDRIRETLEQLRAAWLEGHEIGTHFNGHFCAGPGSVEHWTPADWEDEITQAVEFVTRWRTHTGFDDVEPLPFDYREELTGGRTPCLLGQQNLLPTAAALDWRYDASSPGGLQRWPARVEGVWDFPLQALPFPGRSFEVLSMDYNLMANQSGVTQGDPAQHPKWYREARGAFFEGFLRAYASNRAPLFIGNHFEQWNGGIYMDAVEDSLREMATYEDVRFVSFRQLCDWLDVQDPQVLTRLRDLPVGQAPPAGWAGLAA
ncbi:hypothetical protein PJ985_08410 [Streptomyces sp. ACA25]|uniref:hypothetical protein n=1 Tax=Streptomyces sp. ACA25 TaxID=3022596 RepID=UPI0023075ACF|nr:hypothetical protein [Streptomyces sp. ACA25]MDB1087588.1 hypothetical protein [Streptomyces sp. ACA25]